ncbi:MAG TPA: hypothetical protein VF412_08085 [Bdellovibrio sp.]|uniref:hypothetical protein n=1 Tax=Bdellovibrio sp. TaxID=28201 RepID=UPI002F217D7C
MKDKLNEVSKRLKDLHRRFLEQERVDAEKYYQRRIMPFDFLQMLTNDRNFRWLQPFSALIADIDAMVDEKEALTDADLDGVRMQIDAVLHKADGHSAIYGRYQHHLGEDPEFLLLHLKLREALSQIENKETKKDKEREHFNGSGTPL